MRVRIPALCLYVALASCADVRSFSCSSELTADAPIAAERAPIPPLGRTRNVGVLVFPGVELLDFAGPVETFTNTERWDRPLFVYTIGADLAPLKTLNAVTVVPDFDVMHAPPPDILVIPGGEVRTLSGDTPLAHYIQSQIPKCEIVFSVCNGIFALTDGGWLDELSATTHWTAIGFLRSAAPRTKVLEDTRFVDNGHIVTAAGISAGIDGALHIVHRLLGADTARKTARRMEYEWRGAPAGDDAEQGPLEHARKSWYGGDWKATVAAYQPLAEQHPDDVVVLARLGTALLFTGKPADGVVHLERAAALGSHDVLLYEALGFARSRLDRHAEAVAAYEHGIELEQGRISLYRGLGNEQAALGRHAEAAANLRRAWDANQGDPKMVAQIARSLAASGQRDDAIRFLTTLAHEEPEDLPEVLADPVFDPLRADPRFAALPQKSSVTRP